MSKSNPTIVLDAINESPKQFGKVTINPITITRYSYLEMLSSPFIDSTKKFDVTSIVPSIFALAADKATLRKYSSKNIDDLVADAFEWADTALDLNDLPAIIRDVVAKFTDVNEAAPEQVTSDDGTGKKN